MQESRFRDFVDEPLIVAQNGVQFREPGDVDQTVSMIPSRLVVGRIGGVAAGGVVHDHHPSQFEKGGADAEDVGGIGGYDACSLFHRQQGPPSPFLRISVSVSFGSRNA